MVFRMRNIKQVKSNWVWSIKEGEIADRAQKGSD